MRLRLLVEGKNDAHVLRNLLGAHKIADVDVPEPNKEQEGVASLVRRVRAEIIASHDTPVGLIADANGDLDGRWRSLRDRLAGDEYPLPSGPDPQGTVVTPGNRPALGIWLMPDNASTGTIEDFFLRLIPADDDLLRHARAAIAGLPEDLKPEHPAKATVNTWLAWQRERRDADVRAGQAIARKLVNAEAPLALAFVAWIRRMLAVST